MAGNSFLDPLTGQLVEALPSLAPIPELDLNGIVHPLEGSEIDLSGVVTPMEQMPGGVPPLDPGTAVLNPDGTISPVAEDPILNPQIPRYVDREAGSASKSTTITQRTPGAIDAEKDALSAAKEQESAMLEKATADSKLIEAEAQAAERDNRVISEIETARAQAQQDIIQDVQMRMADVDNRMAALANEPPQTFWGDKTTGDKISAALSVGLGGFGQALLGSGQNVGMVLLNRQMDEFDRNQERTRQTQLKQIESLRTSANMKLKLIDEVDKTYDARKMAARAKVAADMGKMATMAKTGQVKAQAAVQVAQLEQKVAEMRMENEAKYATKATENVEKKTYERIMLQPGMGPDGKQHKLTEGEAKSRMAYADVQSANKFLKNIDLVKLATEDEGFKIYQMESDFRRGVDKLPIVGTLGSALMDLGGTPEESLSNRSPKAMVAVSAMNTWVDSVTRLKTGAAIQPDEIEKERRKYFPTRGDTPEVIRNKAETRAKWEKALKEAAAIYD